MSLSITPLNDAFVVSPQIIPDDIKTIVELGYRTIINNRPDHEEANQPRNADIERSARELGVSYHFLPVVGQSITEEQVAHMNALLQKAAGPVFAFCRSGARCTKLYEMVLQVRQQTS